MLYTDPNFGFYRGDGGVALDSKENIYGAADFCPSGWPCMFEVSAGGGWTDLVDICCGGQGTDTVTSDVIADKNGFAYAGVGEGDIAGGGWVQESLGMRYGCCASIVSSLRQNSGGDIYISEYGNAGGGTDDGTIQKLTVSTGALTTVYAFCTEPNCPDGSDPTNLTLDSSGNVYGINSIGVFKVTSSVQRARYMPA